MNCFYNEFIKIHDQYDIYDCKLQIDFKVLQFHAHKCTYTCLDTHSTNSHHPSTIPINHAQYNACT